MIFVIENMFNPRSQFEAKKICDSVKRSAVQFISLENFPDSKFLNF